MAINGTDYGAGTTLGPYNTRDDQLQGISGMINGF